ncbi:MAG: sulfatase [Deltaproteobacteria bacterium]|nr:sulfatase [Deltaproteobacteria bacterium]
MLIVVVDTLRADRLRAYDPDASMPSPAFDRLAGGGQLFELAYAHASWTKPSVATLLTGVLPGRHGATTHERALDESVPLLAECMSAAGYETGAFVANGYIGERFGFERGFDEFRNAAQTGRGRGDELVEDLLRWIDARDSGAPFFGYLHTTDVHAPYLPRAETLAALDAAPYRGPIDFDGAPNLLQRIERGEVPLTGRDRTRLEALYDAGAYDHDELVLGPLVEGLHDRGLLRNTLVVFTSDHGEELFDHGSVGHGGTRVWEELIHVPLVIHWPGLAPARIAGSVGLVSIAATITDATGVRPMTGLDGVSLVPVLEAGRGSTGPVLGATGGLSFAVHGHYKLVRSRGQADAWMDLVRDPWEHASAPNVGRKDVARLTTALTLATRVSSPRRTPPPIIDADTLERLRALGYVH